MDNSWLGRTSEGVKGERKPSIESQTQKAKQRELAKRQMQRYYNVKNSICEMIVTDRDPLKLEA